MESYYRSPDKPCRDKPDKLSPGKDRSVKYLLGIGVVILILALVGRAAIRALRDLIVSLWPH